MYVDTYVNMYVYKAVEGGRVRPYIYIYIYIIKYINIYVCMYIKRLRADACGPTFIYILYIYTYICILYIKYIYTCIYIYMYIKRTRAALSIHIFRPNFCLNLRAAHQAAYLRGSSEVVKWVLQLLRRPRRGQLPLLFQPKA
jgi:hypothetical protein